MPNETDPHRQKGKKRKYYSRAEPYGHGSSNTSRIPKGQPCILVSCDPARELKCQREVLEILTYDWEIVASSKKDEPPLTLDQELAKLKQTPPQGPFLAFETGCKGALLVVCTQCKPIVSSTPKTGGKEAVDAVANPPKRTKVVENDPAEENAKLVTSSAEEADTNTQTRTTAPEKSDQVVVHDTWDPIQSVHRITDEMAKTHSTYPDSRFCTKLTPFQTLIFADMDKIEYVVQQLLRQHIDKTDAHSATFAIRIHRRLGSLSREEIIAKVGDIVTKVAPQWTVQLKQPDVIVWIEIIKNLAGISLLTSPIQNLTAVREQRTKASHSTTVATVSQLKTDKDLPTTTH